MTKSDLNKMGCVRVTRLLRAWYGDVYSARRIDGTCEVLQWTGFGYGVVAAGATWYETITEFESKRMN